jgi:hypothetical protein
MGEASEYMQQETHKIKVYVIKTPHKLQNTWRRCVLEKLMLTQIVGKCKASLHVHTSPPINLS